MTKIVIVAGGLATRMRPITEEIPKCLIDINGVPLIEHQLNEFKRQGFTEVIFCVAHLAEKVKEYFGDGSKWGMKIEYVQETKKLLGTAGSVKLAQGLIDGDFIVYYGDNLTDMNLKALLAYHKAKGGVGTIVVRPLPKGYKSSSIITLDWNKRISVFLEKPPIEEFEKYASEDQYINSGIYVFSKVALSFVPEGQKFDFAKQLFPLLMDEGLYGYPTGEFFREIGRVEKYETFLQELSGSKDVFSIKPKKKSAVFLDRDGVINKNCDRLSTPEQFEMLPRVPEAIKKLNDAGLLTVIVTSQPDISKGFLTKAALKEIHAKMTEGLGEARIDRIFVCPHHPEKGFSGELPELKFDCACRKPKPGLILDAARELNIDLSHSFMVGDSKVDILAGKAAGVKTFFVTSGGGSLSRQEKTFEDVSPDRVVSDLSAAVSLILQ